MIQRKDENTLHTIRTYNALADAYEEQYCTTIYFQEELDRFLKHLKEKSSILDIGCGTGHIAAYLTTKGFKVTGIDISSAMIKKARQKAPTATFYQADMREISFPPRSFDAIIAAFSLIHIPKEETINLLTRFHEILTPRGHLFIGVIEGEGEELITEPLDKEGKHKTYFQYYQKNFLTQELERQGFTIITITDRQFKDEHEEHNEFFITAQKKEE